MQKIDHWEQPATAVFPLCKVIKSDGIRCGSPAMKGGNFCFQHIGGDVNALTRALSVADSQTRRANAKLNFVYPGDREAIQHNLFLVAQAFSAGKIDSTEANTFNRIFRSCELNLRRWETAKETQRMLPRQDATEVTGQPSASSNQENISPHEVVISTGVRAADEAEEPTVSQPTHDALRPPGEEPGFPRTGLRLPGEEAKWKDMRGSNLRPPAACPEPEAPSLVSEAPMSTMNPAMNNSFFQAAPSADDHYRSELAIFQAARDEWIKKHAAQAKIPTTSIPDR